MTIDRKALQTIVDLSDPVGVLSVYATLDPQAESTARPAWQVQIRNELVALDRRLRQDGDVERAEVLAARLADLERELGALLAAATPGRGRALFVPLIDGVAHAVSVQLLVGNLVVLAPTAYVRPLVAAWCAGPPTGIAAVSGAGVRLLDLRFGHAQDAGTFEYRAPATDPAQGWQHDVYARRAAEHLARFLHATGPRIAARAGELDWEYLVVTGEPEEAMALVSGLPHNLAAQIVTAAHRVATMSAARIAAAVEPELAAARHRHGQRLAAEARDTALGGRAGAYGLADTLTALNQGRVSHLLLDASAEWSGQRGPDGRLHPFGIVVPGVPARAMSPEPRLGEQMIAATLRQGGAVTLLEPADAAALAGAGGAAALLRW